MCACAQTKELFCAQRPELKHAIKLTQPRCSKRTPSTKTIHAPTGAETECTSHRRRRVFRRPLQRALPGHELSDTPSPHTAHQKRRRQRRDSVRERSSVLVLCVCRVCSDCSHSGQRYIGSCVLLGLQKISSWKSKYYPEVLAGRVQRKRSRATVCYESYCTRFSAPVCNAMAYNAICNARQYATHGIRM